MRVVESVGFYYPDSTGGTEAYVSALAKYLQARGSDCWVAAPSASEQTTQYVEEGIQVFRYSVPERWLRREIQGRQLPRGFDIFKDWLYWRKADVYHQHSWTTGCGPWHLKAAKGLGLRTVLTVHVPGNICMRGTMLYEGRVACDGEIVPERCASCWLQSKGLHASAALRMAKIPESMSFFERLPRVGPALCARALAAGRIKDLQAMTAAADRIIVVCQWLHEALLANGVPPRRLILNRQGVEGPESQRSRRAAQPSDVVRFGFLGRWDPVKGVHVLVEAFKRLSADLAVALKICASGQGNVAQRYRDDIHRSVVGDPRIRVMPPIAHQDVPMFLSEIDVLAVPSQWLETGPLVVLEAFAAGTPVIGSDLGGIRELVSHGQDGILVPHDDANAWTAAITRLAKRPALLERLRKGIGPVRTMSDVGCDMAALYRELTGIGRYAA
jgi:glycosyltransferase involved in cell wall biosynthesis